MRVRVESAAFGTLAVCWFAGLIVFVAGEAYQALRYGGSLGGGFGISIWVKLYVLAASTGVVVSIAALVGLGMATIAGDSAALLAKRLAVVLGAWTVVVGLAGIVTSMHGYGYGRDVPVSQRIGQPVAFLGQFGLALVVTVIAWGLASSGRGPRTSAEAGHLRADVPQARRGRVVERGVRRLRDLALVEVLAGDAARRRVSSRGTPT